MPEQPCGADEREHEQERGAAGDRTGRRDALDGIAPAVRCQRSESDAGNETLECQRVRSPVLHDRRRQEAGGEEALVVADEPGRTFGIAERQHLTPTGHAEEAVELQPVESGVQHHRDDPADDRQHTGPHGAAPPGRARPPGEDHAAPDERQTHPDPDRCAGERGRERAERSAGEGTAIGELRRGPLRDQRDGHDGECQRPQLGLVVDADPSGREQCRRERHSGGEDADRPTFVCECAAAGSHHPAAGSGETRRPPTHHDHRDQHRHPDQPPDEQIAEQHQRKTHQRQQRPVVEVGPAVDQEAFDARDRRIDGESTAQERSSLLVVEVGAEPGPCEQLPGSPRGGDQPEHDDRHHGDRPHHRIRRDRRRPTGVGVGGALGTPDRSGHVAGGSSWCGAVSSPTTNW
jgi:hypothetical protein